ncbi:MAG: helix-turn-helix domain-containing protein [Bacteroidaceae bacterium]|nr:helix-turn-helix domain-containing protein [Bacteroidaceae bacterium]
MILPTITTVSDLWSLLTSFAFLIMTFIFVLCPHPSDRQWKHFNTAGHYLIFAFIVIVIANMIRAFVPSGNNQKLTSSIVMVMASYQSMLITMTAIVFMQPQRVKRNDIVLQLFIITITSLFLFSCVGLSQRVWNIAFFSYVVGYIVLCSLYTRLFMNTKRRCIKELENFYDEEMSYRVQWISRFFYFGLMVGIVALFAAFIPELSKIFGILYSFFYAYFLVCMFRYQFEASYLIRVVADSGTESVIVHLETTEPEEENVESVNKDFLCKEKLLEKNLQTWVENKRYTDTTQSVKEIAEELGVSYNFLTFYFAQTVGEQFRMWRRSLRIEEAKRLLKEEPELSIPEIGEQVGYNDRGNFYRHFTQSVGLTPTAYKEQIEKDR